LVKWNRNQREMFSYRYDVKLRVMLVNIIDDCLNKLSRIFIVERLRRYEKNCHMLDITMDWQLRALLACDNITIFNRSFSFNDIRAFTSAIETNLQSLTLSSVGLSSRSIDILCQRLIKCIHLNLLVNKSDK
jgi:hypothetical protein